MSPQGTTKLEAPARPAGTPDRASSVTPLLRRRRMLARYERTGMRCDPRLSFNQWIALGQRLDVYTGVTAWWLGDWLNFGRERYGRRYRDGVAMSGLEYHTLRNYAMVARRFGLSRRRDNISFQHHAEVSALPDADQDFWLDLAAEQGWSKAELRRRLRASRETPTPRGACAVLRLDLEAQRETAWRQAASLAGRSLEAWVVELADNAAAAARGGER